MRRRLIVLSAAALTLAACGGDDNTSTTTNSDATPSTDPEQVYTATATVLENSEHGPQLCLGGVAESLPPQCGGPDIADWSWDDASGQETADGTTWGEYTVVGTYADGVFTLTEPPSGPAAADGADAEVSFKTPCEEPDGGWQVVDEANATEGAMNAAIEYAERQSEFAGMFVDQSINERLTESQAGGTSDAGDADADAEGVDEAVANDPTKLVLNIRFNGNVEQHEQEIRELWGGALCVSAAEHTESELHAIQDEVFDRYPDALSAGTDIAAGVVELMVIVDDGSVQAGVDDEYGPGVVLVTSALRPVE